MKMERAINYRTLGIKLENCPRCKIQPHMSEVFPDKRCYVACSECGLRIWSRSEISVAGCWNGEILKHLSKIETRSVLFEKVAMNS